MISAKTTAVIKVILLLIFPFVSAAQRTIEGLINAEKAFAAFSADHGIKAAFLRFADSNALISQNGRLVNAIQAWNSRQQGSGLLIWRPEWVEISRSLNFGYTTGPWVFKNSAADTAATTGRFVTVWKSDKSGNWKYLIDLGVSAVPLLDTGTAIEVIRKGSVNKPGSISSLLSTEKEFISLYSKSKDDAYRKFLSNQTILNRNGGAPAIGRETARNVIAGTPSDIQYMLRGSGLSLTGDLGYVFGDIEIGTKRENYLRIWRRESTGWRIALEVLRY